ncbi:MAG: cytochrome c oxidase assembly protein [Gemmatimonadota bacterium]
MNVVVSHWSANAVVLAAYAVVAAVHLLGVRGAAAGAGEPGGDRPARVREAVAFQAGLLVAALALLSPLGYWSHVYVWIRSLQDLLLALVAPGLLVLGAPWQPLARGLALGRLAQPRGLSRGGAAGEADDRPARPRPARGWLTVPVGVTVGYNLAWWAWHLPAGYDASARQPLLYGAEVVTYLGGGILLWRQLIGSRPHSPAFGPLQRVMLLTGTMAASTVLAMSLTFGSGLEYPGYRTPLHLHPLSVVTDQQIGGAVLWMLALPPMLLAGIALLTRWLNDEEAEAAAAGLDRLLTPPKQVWPSRPGLR